MAMDARQHARLALGQAMEATHSRIQGLHCALHQAHDAGLPQAELNNARQALEVEEARVAMADAVRQLASGDRDDDAAAIQALHDAFLRGQAAGLGDDDLQPYNSALAALLQRKDARFALDQAMNATHSRIEQVL